MAETDALKSYQFKEGGGGDLFVKIKEGSPQKLRVLTLDPLVHVDKFANTRYAFIVYNYTESKAMILDKGTSIAKGLSMLHVDEDYDDLNKIDVKISATGEGMETRYAINVLPKTETLTTDQIKECAKLNLEDIIKSGTRMSAINDGEPMPTAEEEPVAGEDEVHEVDDEKPISLDDLNNIPF